MGVYTDGSEYFVYECDEFDRNFLAFNPHLSLVTGVTWDHHEIFPTREDYQHAFQEFIGQSHHTLAWQEDAAYLSLPPRPELETLNSDTPAINRIAQPGRYNRLDAWLAIMAVRRVSNQPVEALVEHMATFPGLQRRMEQLRPGLYSDYAHTPEKIRGGMSVALELAGDAGKELVVVYEPLTNRRQHFMINDYKDCFKGARHVYWLPSYLAREDQSQRVMPPEELIAHLTDPSIAEPAQLDNHLERVIRNHLANNAMVVGMAGGGGGSLDEWLRQHLVDAPTT
jgi:UDP-N-acetylmuramate--alanine ligase